MDWKLSLSLTMWGLPMPLSQQEKMWITVLTVKRKSGFCYVLGLKKLLGTQRVIESILVYRIYSSNKVQWETGNPTQRGLVRVQLLWNEDWVSLPDELLVQGKMNTEWIIEEGSHDLLWALASRHTTEVVTLIVIFMLIYSFFLFLLPNYFIWRILVVPNHKI